MTPRFLNRRLALLAVLSVAFLSAGTLTAQASPSDNGPHPNQSEPYVTFVVFPDTQFETQQAEGMLNAQVNYVLANRDYLNIVGVLHEGDVVNQVTDKQFATARKYFKKLDDADIPMVFAAGNHDIIANGTTSGKTTGRFNSFVAGFPHNQPDGKYSSGDYTNTYRLMDVLGSKYLVITLQFGPTDGMIAWAKSVAAAHKDATVMLLTHDYLTQANQIRGAPGNGVESYLPSQMNGSYRNGYTIQQNFVKQSSNVRFVFSGHIGVRTRGLKWAVGLRRSTSNAGTATYAMMVNFQIYQNGGGWTRFVTLYPASGRVEVVTYSPYQNKQLTDKADKFTLTGVDLGGFAPQQVPGGVSPGATAPDTPAPATPSPTPTSPGTTAPTTPPDTSSSEPAPTESPTSTSTSTPSPSSPPSG